MKERTRQFIVGLESIPWFARIGQPELHARQIGDWDAWSGPEDPLVERIHLEQQDLYDSLVGDDDVSELAKLFRDTRERVIAIARKHVPYEEQEDAWHAPSSAVWHAAWTAGLVAILLERERPIPASLQAQWDWFSQGHWPAAYETTNSFSDFTIY